MKGAAVQSFGGQENKTEMSVTMICDGDSMYTLSTQMGQTMATKQKPDASLGGDLKKYFEDIIAKHNVKVLPDEKIDGEACFVIEATPKDPAAAASIAKTIMYFRKDIGINVKMVGMDKDGKEVFSNISSDFKINSDIAADRFVFKAPEGVQVMDMTGSTPPGGE
jgi:outer membrane lipoprotein-sorting protein